MPDAPEVWTDGSLVLDQVTGVPAAGAGFFAHQSEHCWSSRRWSHVGHVQLDRVVQWRWGHVDHVHLEGKVHCCRGFCLCAWAFADCSAS